MNKDCPLKKIPGLKHRPKSCFECCFEKQELCDFPYIGKVNAFRLIEVWLGVKP